MFLASGSNESDVHVHDLERIIKGTVIVVLKDMVFPLKIWIKMQSLIRSLFDTFLG